MTLLPERKLGIIVFTNQESGAAFSAITNTIKDSYLGLVATDWVGKYGDREKKGRAEADSITRAIWTDIDSARKTSEPINFSDEVFHYKNNTFVVKWNLRSMNADAYLTFAVDENLKPVSITMKPISPLTDFSYDFQDLDLQRVKGM